jgi:hypothetical protein
MPLRIAFPLISLVYGLGNWLTYLALIVYVQTQAGSSASAGTVCTRNSPALLVSGQIARAVPTTGVRSAWVACQVVLAAMTVPAAFFVSHLWVVYAYAGTSMIVRAVANPLLLTLVSASVPRAESSAVLRSVSATAAVTLAVAPALGGSLLPVVGPTWLLLVNAALFLCVGGAVLLHPRLSAAPRDAEGRHREHGTEPRPNGSWFRLPGFAGLVRVEGADLRSWRHPFTRLWMLLLIGGAVLNIIETPLVFSVVHLDETVFGWMLAAYGVGGLLVLVSNLRTAGRARTGRTAERRGTTLSGSALAAGFAMLVVIASGTTPTLATAPIAILSFGFLGFGGSWLSGTARAWLNASFEGRGVDTTKAMWTWASQVTLAINLVVYLTFFVVFTATPAGVWVLAPALAAYGCLLVALARTRPPRVVAA